MSAPGLTPRRRSALAWIVVVCLALGAGSPGAWVPAADSSAAPETSPQLAAAAHPSSPALAEGTRKSSADSVNLLPKSGLLARPGPLPGVEGDALALHCLEAAGVRNAFSAAVAIRAPPDHA